MSILFASDLDHLFADCSGCSPTLFETECIDGTVIISSHNHHSVVGVSCEVKNPLFGGSPSLSQI